MTIIIIVVDENGDTITFNLPGVSTESIAGLSFGSWPDGDLKLNVNWKNTQLCRSL